MDMGLKERFLSLWKKYFNKAEPPLAFYYTDEEGRAELAVPGSVPRCFIGALSGVRKGRPLSFNADPGIDEELTAVQSTGTLHSIQEMGQT